MCVVFYVVMKSLQLKGERKSKTFKPLSKLPKAILLNPHKV